MLAFNHFNLGTSVAIVLSACWASNYV